MELAKLMEIWLISNMPITLSYDLETDGANHRSYIRSMLERFHWQRVGGSVFRYRGIAQPDGTLYEDWLNDVAPSVMFLRAYVLAHGIQLKFFTVDAASSSFLDHSDPTIQLGILPQSGQNLVLGTPTNNQSSAGTIRGFVDAASTAAGQ